MSGKFLPEIVGPVKRVVRQDGYFICGICQETHDQWPQALACLWDCWKSFLALPPVVMRKSGRIQSYRCRYCARDYHSQNEALTCGSTCADYARKEFELEWALLGFIPPLERKPKPKPVLMVVQKLPPKTKKPKKDLTEENNSPDESGASPQASPSAGAAPSSGETTAPAKTEENKDKGPAPANAPAKKDKAYGYYREGARYVCEVCSGKYFTKGEVINCVKSHQ